MSLVEPKLDLEPSCISIAGIPNKKGGLIVRDTFPQPKSLKSVGGGIWNLQYRVRGPDFEYLLHQLLGGAQNFESSLHQLLDRKCNILAKKRRTRM